MGSPRTSDSSANASRRGPITAQVVIVAIIGIVLLGLAAWVAADYYTALPANVQAQYVGRQSCIQCHTAEHTAWKGSDHDLAMDLATPETVLGDFNNAEVVHHDIVSKMYRDGSKYMIRTEGPDGQMGDFEIKYVFGVRPLQQYMVEFDRTPEMSEKEIARLQVLRISWDTEKKEWFYLAPTDAPEKLAPDDMLHWTGVAQCWNTMCADCHSTNLQKNFDASTGHYHTTFSEIDVSCEACHGPGSVHVQLAESKSLFWDRIHGYGLAKLKSEDAKVEIESCAPCHSRRRIVHPHYRPGEKYGDFFANELLQEDTYHADGQILDEVYVYGSFIQSKMYHKNIRCTDCHDPHTTRLKYEGNRVCTSCHQHPEAKYDTPAHHHHKTGSEGASCVECHMPEATYMAVDHRRDHSLRVPRPDLSVQLDLPNACSRCHLEHDKLEPKDRDDLKQYNDYLVKARDGDTELAALLHKLNERMADAAAQWYGKPKEDPAREELAAALLQSRRFDRNATPTLDRLARNRLLPAIHRATALSELGRFPGSPGREAARSLLDDADPQVRTAAVALYEMNAPEIEPTDNEQQRVEKYRSYVNDLLPLLDDPVRSVRIETARVMATVPMSFFKSIATAPQQQKFETALDAYVISLLSSSERGGAHLALGLLYDHLGKTDKAIEAYRTAIRIQPTMTGPRANLAELYDRQAEETDREIKQAMNAYQQAALQARQIERQEGEKATQAAEKNALEKRAQIERLAVKAGEAKARAEALRAEEFPLQERDAQLLPNSGPVQYRWALALYLRGRYEDAETYMQKAYDLEPRNPQFVLGLALLLQKREKFQKALELANQLVELVPDNRGYQNLQRDLKTQAAIEQFNEK